MENERTASPPSAGAGRDTIRNALGALIGAGIAWLLPEGTEPQVRAATAAIVWGLVVSPALALWGKWLRGRGIKAMFVLPLVVWLAGCAWNETGTSKGVGWGRMSSLIEETTYPDGTVTKTQIVCTAGLTGVFGELFRGLGNIAGGVFGSPGHEGRRFEAMEECRGLLESAQEPDEPLPD